MATKGKSLKYLSRSLRLLAKFTGVSAVTVFAGICLIYKYQRKLIYFNNRPNRLPSTNEVGFRNPGEAQLDYEDVYVTTSDGMKLHGWFVKTETPEQSPTIVVFQGRTGNIGHRVPFLSALYKYCNANLFIIGYRGYSFNEGEPTEKGIKIDAEAAMDYVFSREGIKKDQIFVLGSSMGGAVAIHAVTAKPNQVAGVILENTFTSMLAMIDAVCPKFAAKLLQMILIDRWESDKIIHKIQSPILFLIGLKDELIPPSQTRKLQEAATSSPWKEVVEIENGNHVETWSIGEKVYMNGIHQFMEKAGAENRAKIAQKETKTGL